MDEEIKNFLAAGHLERIDKITVEMFIQPVVLTVKKDRSNKIGLDARSPNNAILEDEHQMANLESLMETVAEIINGKKEGDVWFTSLDMVYALDKQYYIQKQRSSAFFRSSGEKRQALTIQNRLLLFNNNAA